MNHLKKNSVLIIGAGSSGLTLGYLLSQKGFGVTLLEKSGGVGGRIATRRWEQGQWDHGIPWLNKEEVPEFLWKLWSPVLRETLTSDGSRFMAPQGLTEVAKVLAKDLNVHKKSRAINIEFLKENRLWKVTDDTSQDFFSSQLVFTSPAPQVLEILKASNLLKETGLEKGLSSFVYRPQLVALAKLEISERARVNESLGSPFELSVDKGMGFTTFYLDESFTTSRWNQSDDEIIQEVRLLIEKQNTGTLQHLELKRWRFSRCTNPSSMDFLSAITPGPLHVIGDAFCKGGLQGALQSALRLSEVLKIS